MNTDPEQLLLRRKIKPTAMRLIVLKFLMQHKHAVSLKDLEAHLESTDRVTLFRTLKTFEVHKVIHSINDGSGAVKYGLCLDNCECDYPQDVHIHFHCKVCNETKCLHKVKVPAINLPESFSAEEANVVIKGICDTCSV